MFCVWTERSEKCEVCVLLASKTLNLCCGAKEDMDPGITEHNTMHAIII